MDPLTVFPPEIIHQIWRHLDPADLLAARAVAPHWLASISDCPGAWVTDFSHDWTEFLTFKKAVRSWSSKSIRRETIRNVRDCLFTDFAYYLLYGEGSLEMFAPNGDSVRIFNRPATDLHRGEKCLLIGVDETDKTTDLRTRHRTIITDFVFNYLDDMLDTRITASSPNGYAYELNGEHFFTLGPDIPGRLKITCDSDIQLYFMTSCAVSVQGFTVKTVQLFDAETQLSIHLKSSVSSPRWIPSVEIVPGPEDYFCVIVEQRDFNTISVYHRDAVLYEESFPWSFKCLFTEEYFVISLQDTVTAFKLADFTKHYQLNLPAHYDISSTIYEPWSLLKNTFAVFNSDPARWIVYRLSEIRRTSTTTTKSTLAPNYTKLEPKLQLLAANATCQIAVNGGLSISEFHICPRYAFKITSAKSTWSGNERVVHLLYFDL